MTTPRHNARDGSSETLVRVSAPHFVAGLVLQDGVCTETAPILKWARGMAEEALRIYFRDKGWKATRPHPLTEQEQT